MKRVRYTKFTGDLASEMDIEDLLQGAVGLLARLRLPRSIPALSGPRSHSGRSARSTAAAARIRRIFDDRMREQLEQMGAQGKLDELIEKLIERMEQENYISYSQNMSPTQMAEMMGNAGNVQGEVQVRSHGQEPRFSGLQDAARSAGIAGQVELWPARHAALGHGR